MTAGARTPFRTFAYGSNMLSARLKERCPSARPLGVAQLPGHELRWHKRSKDRSGKCDVVPVSGDHAVFGVVYEIDANEKADLDQVEGLGNGYDQKDATVILCGDAVTVSIYFATKTDPARKPYAWYKALVVAGAKEHGLPTPYIAGLEAVEASEDPDRTRHDTNMRIVSAVSHRDGAQA
jgi:gamma-glutamylcyclotransferase